MISVNFRINDLFGHEVEAKLEALVEAFGDTQPLMEHLGGVLETQVDERFDSQQGPDGERWSPSARVKSGGGSKTLTDRAIMRNSIHSIANRTSVEVGTNIKYAGVHQGGATIRAKTSKGLRFQLPGGLGWRRVMEVEIPARPFLGLSQDNTSEILDEIDAFFAERIGD